MEIDVTVGRVEIFRDKTLVVYWAWGNHEFLEKDEKGYKTFDTKNRYEYAEAEYLAGEEKDESGDIKREIKEEIEYRLQQVKDVFLGVTENDINIHSFLEMVRDRFQKDC